MQPPPRQEMEYLCAGMSPDPFFSFKLTKTNRITSQTVVQKTRSGLVNPFVVENAGIVSCIRNERGGVRCFFSLVGIKTDKFFTVVQFEAR